MICQKLLPGPAETRGCSCSTPTHRRRIILLPGGCSIRGKRRRRRLKEGEPSGEVNLCLMAYLPCLMAYLPCLMAYLPTYLPSLRRLSETSGREVRRGRCSRSSPNSAASGRIRPMNSRCSSGETRSGCSGVISLLCFAPGFLSIRLPRIPGTRCRRTGRRSEMG
ncbi:hypothetical protein DSECCO2_630980 [anaerobic digester metagenome]